MTDSLTVFGTDYTGVTGIKAKGTGNGTLTYIRPQGTKSISTNGTGIDVTEYAAVDVSVSGGGSPSLQSKSATPTESSQTIEPDSGYDGLSSVTVGAISSTYVGSGIDRNDSSDLTASGATVSVPAGYYSSDASKTIPEGEFSSFPTVEANNELTHIKVIQKIATAGYMPVSTSGTYTKSISNILPTQAGTTITPTSSQQTAVSAKNWVTGDIVVDAMPSGTEGTPTASKGTVSNHAISVTPSVTNSAGYIAGGTKTGTAVSVSASELVSGTYTVDSSGTKDVTNYASASVPAGTAGTPSASKGTVSNHAISVTPSVTNSTGWITGGSKSGTAVSVSASELVSGTYTVDSSGTKDVTNYASASVAAGGATASATKGTVSNHSISVTPSVTRTAGWVTAGSANGTAVTVSASELVSGSETKTANGTYDVTNLASLVVNISYSTIYTGTGNPSSSQGSNGDVYLKTVS